MWRRWVILGLMLALTGLSAGCFGGAKATGKFSNQDKPKPVEGQK
jgi:hypothetical protein